MNMTDELKAACGRIIDRDRPHEDYWTQDDHDVYAVAIALRVGVPIYVEEAVLAEAGLLIPDENDDEATGAVREDEVEKFKEFLDSVSPDDFKAT